MDSLDPDSLPKKRPSLKYSHSAHIVVDTEAQNKEVEPASTPSSIQRKSTFGSAASDVLRKLKGHETTEVDMEVRHEQILTKLGTSFRNIVIHDVAEAKTKLTGTRCCIAHPGSVCRVMWDVLTVILVLYSAWSIPLLVAF